MIDQSEWNHAEKVACLLAGVIEVLADALSDKNEKVRRRVMATLGELLFYVATQQQVRKPAILVSPPRSCHPVQLSVLACLLALSTNTTANFGLHIFRTALDCARLSGF